MTKFLIASLALSLAACASGSKKAGEPSTPQAFKVPTLDQLSGTWTLAAATCSLVTLVWKPSPVT